MTVGAILKRGRARRASLAGALLTALFATSPAGAQDALTAAPHVYKKVMENNRMRVLEGHFKPGDKAALHSHPEHLLYMLTPGTLVIKPPGRTAYEMSLKPGEAIFLPAQTRATENDTNETVRVLIVEIKAPPPQAKRKGKSRRSGRGKRGRRR